MNCKSCLRFKPEYRIFDLIKTVKIGLDCKVEYYLCNCDKIYIKEITPNSESWSFLKYDNCVYCTHEKDLCNCGKEPKINPKIMI